MEFADQIVIVTGASSGIGRECALKFVREGARVAVVSGSDISRSESVVAECAGQGSSKAYAADVRDPDAARRLVRRVTEDLGAPSVLVNCAGVFYPTPAGDTSDDAARQIIDVNLAGTWNMINAVVPAMKARQRGVILNFASVAAVLGLPSFSLYCATKASIQMLTRALATELAPQGIRINAISPGNTATPMNQAVRTDPNFGANLDFLASRTPSDRTFTPPEEIAELVLLLASDRGRAMHGSTLLADEGISAGLL